jgi:hypothetical protein
MADDDTPARRRERVLEAVYDLAEGTMTALVRLEDVRATSGQDEESVNQAIMFWNQQGYLGTVTFGAVTLNSRGVAEVERWRERDRPKSLDAWVMTELERQQVEAALGELDQLNIVDSLEGEQLAVYEADRATIAAQLRSPEPQRAVVKPLLKRLAGFAAAVAAGVVAAKLERLL